MDELAAEWGSVDEIVVRAQLGQVFFRKIAPLLDPSDRNTPLHVLLSRRCASIAVLESLWRHGFDADDGMRSHVMKHYRRQIEDRDAALEQLQIAGRM